MDDWFFHPDLPEAGGVIMADPLEARHAVGPRRLGIGAAITIFDGRGGIARCEIESLIPREKTFAAVVIRRETARPNRPAVHLICALPKGDRVATLLSMATQLGMSSFAPLVSERTVVKPRRAVLERWRRIAIEACKQSRNPWLPEFRSPVRFADLASAGEMSGGSPMFLAHPGGEAIGDALRDLDPAVPRTFLIGPEGGFSENEIDALGRANAVRTVDLGPRLLRIETAAVTVLAVAGAL